MNTKTLKWLALFTALGLAPAQAQNFTMPPPAGVFVGGYQVVASCGAQSLTAGKPAFATMDMTGTLCTAGSGGGGGATAANQVLQLAQETIIATNTAASIPPQVAPYTIIGGVVAGPFTHNNVAASQTAQVLNGASAGATGNYLSHCVITPATTSPGAVTVFDNTSTAANNVIAFAGGASSVSNLVPFSIPVAANSANGAWKATTGANVIVDCYVHN